jgi:hypothetical protein
VGKSAAEVAEVLEKAGGIQASWIEHRPSISLAPEYYREIKEKLRYPGSPVP